MKLDRFSYHQKSLFLLAGTILLLLFTYVLSINKTIEVTKSIRNLDKRILMAQTAPIQIDSLQTKIDIWNKNLLSEVSLSEIQQRIFDEVARTDNINTVTIKGIKRIDEKKENGITISTYEIDFTGEFKTLVETLNHLERKMRYGYILSSSFEIVKNRKKRIDELRLKLIVQSMIQNY
ncbi:hypothetical protein SLH46_21025 [Draconibacterium sp. IB214405]|uniref:hypothetical protein n=1 Tax=Draconibacterium sp. IB214405 TaxID=3097352 RepID=UPI002A0BFFFF|nr:hypothetical protein [Draconibacterium sp. IB214405]MDX8341695.1 hypothetical protein [Draconibacterium sp. IB214405]